MKLRRIKESLKTSGKFIEQRNFFKLAAKLVDYGIASVWLPNDSLGADFLAVQHYDYNRDCSNIYQIQLKARMSLSLKYKGKDIYLAFPLDDSNSGKNWVIIKHDTLERLYFSHPKSRSKFESLEAFCTKNSSDSWSNNSVPKYMVDDVIDNSIIGKIDID
ncbi:hypothetical protein [Streptococcus sobrinus]|uniref:PD(D/E)XK endonuclease domain-containing protein n=2 Tax=Streptococcus sobrinus TaxID=1310 RepID=U2J7R4_9STRE|nr:hypothetical protein [Streptococcus sobrinus]AWN20269.1 hypothetical protein DK182_02445 [Streptococcus sobrinus]AWN61119.1 hypothetical protein DLJ52_02395 [Streptococcus sobrinus]AWN62992.1 hypothetical protein DLJ51_02395 [Streptococcus sobrinus]EMP72243.1 hypothetical protein D823_04172 [Streptococcus sobrinus DSM 20742 = ATCC 33478]ERJ75830.1 hypothetical protein HMPREF1557_01345 [Streptococcus sobrinus W1703]